MKTLKTKKVKFQGESETLKLKQLNEKDKKELNINSNYVITFGEYEDIDQESDSINEALEQYNYWGID